MARAVCGVLEHPPAAHAAVQGLLDSGFLRENISVVAREGGTGAGAPGSVSPPAAPPSGAPAGAGAVAGGLIGALTDLGVSEDEARSYVDGLRRGGVLLIVRAEGMMIERAAAILQQHGAVNIDRRAEPAYRLWWAGKRALASATNPVTIVSCCPCP